MEEYAIIEPRSQGLLGIFQNGCCSFEKYPEGPGDEVGYNPGHVISAVIPNAQSDLEPGPGCT